MLPATLLAAERRLDTGDGLIFGGRGSVLGVTAEPSTTDRILNALVQRNPAWKPHHGHRVQTLPPGERRGRTTPQRRFTGAAGVTTRRCGGGDRDLSWIEFNRRVLAEALDDRTPLLERVKFLAIFTSNLDEFFMKRIAVLREPVTPAGQQLIGQIRDRLLPMLQQQAEYFLGRLVPELSQHGIHLRPWAALSAAQQQEAGAYFDTQVSPALTPLVIQPSAPFPFFSNLSLSLAFTLHDERTGESVDARVKVPSELAQWVRVCADVPPGQQLFVRLHEVIREHAHRLYPGMRLTAPTLFRLTRDAEVELDGHGDHDVRELVREQIRQRRYEPVVRLEIATRSAGSIGRTLQERFALTPEDIYDLPGELDYTSLFIAALALPDLRDAPWTPVTPRLTVPTRISSTSSAPAISWSITPTTASTTASNGSSAPPPTTRTPWPSR